MATRTPPDQIYHSYWGVFANELELPNVSGSPTQDGSLEPGDRAVSTDGRYTLWVCAIATLNAAIWVPQGIRTTQMALDSSWPIPFFTGGIVDHWQAAPSPFHQDGEGVIAPTGWTATRAGIYRSAMHLQGSHTGLLSEFEFELRLNGVAVPHTEAKVTILVGINRFAQVSGEVTLDLVPGDALTVFASRTGGSAALEDDGTIWSIQRVG